MLCRQSPKAWRNGASHGHDCPFPVTDRTESILVVEPGTFAPVRELCPWLVSGLNTLFVVLESRDRKSHLGRPETLGHLLETARELPGQGNHGAILIH